MTALVTRRARLARRRHDDRRLPRRRRSSRSGRLRPRRARHGPRPPARAAGHLAPTTRPPRSPSASRGTRAKFVAMMNAKARQLGLSDTHFANPIGLDNEENYSTRDGPREDGADPAPERVPARRRSTCKQVDADVRRAPAHVRQPQPAGPQRPAASTASRPATRNSAGYILVGSADAQRHHGRLGRPRRPVRGRARRRLARAPASTAWPATTSSRRSRRARSSATSALAAPRRARRPRRRRRPSGAPRAAATGSSSRVTGAPTTIDGPLAKGARVGTRHVTQRGKVVARVPLVTADAVDAATFFDRLRDWLGSPVTLVLLAAFAVCSLYLVLLRRRAVRRRQRRRAGQGGTRRVIITVTLNAAIDKSLSVPNFRLGRRHRTVEQRTAAGGKGVNIARALKTLGQPVIATGFAGGPTGTRIVDQLTEESILNDFVRIREESRTNTAVFDPTNGQQTEINERGPAVSDKRDRAVPRQAALPRARRRHGRHRRLAAARRRPGHLRDAHPRAAQVRRADDRSTPTASRCATPCAPSPT